METWIRTTTTRGGKVIGFGNLTMQNSTRYDKQVYMANNGRLVFGVYSGGYRTVTTTGAYNDGNWHHVVATQGTGGMALYVDGQAAGVQLPLLGQRELPGVLAGRRRQPGQLAEPPDQQLLRRPDRRDGRVPDRAERFPGQRALRPEDE